MQELSSRKGIWERTQEKKLRSENLIGRKGGDTWKVKYSGMKESGDRTPLLEDIYRAQLFQSRSKKPHKWSGNKRKAFGGGILRNRIRKYSREGGGRLRKLGIED